MSMRSLKQQKGFTIVELLIVIVVIGILATLVIVTFTGIQQKARNTKRQTDINAIQSHVEAYKAQNGYYPSRANINDTSTTPRWIATNMKGLDPSALQDPKGSAQTVAAATSATSYGYAPVNDAGTTCEADATTCSGYTLEATLEGGGTYQKKSN
jgi:type II secretion system protein G